MTSFVISVSVETSYQRVYYLSDIVLAVCALFSIFTLKQEGMKGKAKAAGGGKLKSLKQLINPAVVIFWATLACGGIVCGITLDWVPVFVQDKLGAPSSMIGTLFKTL